MIITVDARRESLQLQSKPVGNGLGSKEATTPREFVNTLTARVRRYIKTFLSLLVYHCEKIEGVSIFSRNDPPPTAQLQRDVTRHAVSTHNVCLVSSSSPGSFHKFRRQNREKCAL
jgi:hypothetical protein